MGTDIRPEVSKSNRYWIPKHRYYELKHFCLQYPIWKHKKDSMNGYFPSKSAIINEPIQESGHSDPTAWLAEYNYGYSKRMEMVELAAITTDDLIGPYILECVTNGFSYDQVNANRKIPCEKGHFYELYRKFFWILNDIRD